MASWIESGKNIKNFISIVDWIFPLLPKKTFDALVNDNESVSLNFDFCSKFKSTLLTLIASIKSWLGIKSEPKEVGSSLQLTRNN